MRQRDVEQLPHLVMRFLSMMPDTLLVQYKVNPKDTFRKEVVVRVRAMHCRRGYIRVALKGPEPEDTAYFNISYREAEKAAHGGVGEVYDLVQGAAGDGMDFIEENHKLWDEIMGR